MFSLFASLLTLLTYEKVSIDNQVFKMHYRVTMVLLVMFSILIASKEHFGEPIRCHQPGAKENHVVVDMYCWVRGSFTVNKLQYGDYRYTAHQGVGHFVQGEDAVTHVKYYQWVGIVLLLQAFMFYVPHFLWSCWEGGRVKMLCNDLGDPVVGPEWNPNRQRILAEYLSGKNAAMHNLYAGQYALCEVLNLINVLVQIFFLNIFFQGEFLSYGLELAKYSVANETTGPDPMDKLFPKMAKCEFRKFGPSGGIENMDALCVLPLNSLNEKVFAIVWFWFLVLGLLSTMAAIYRAALILSPYLRSLLIVASTRQISRQQVARLNASLSFGSWFMLSQLSKNIHPTVFRELLSELYSDYCTSSLTYKSKQADVP